MFVENSHFKMESIYTVLTLVTSNCWMASLDLQDAYYSVKIHPDLIQKFLNFLTKALFTSTRFSLMVYASAQETLVR